MVKFAHISDCHLGGWRQQELRELNLESFKKVIDTCIQEKVDFVLITGDLFDSAYPPIETLEFTFEQLKKLKEHKIKTYYIAGSHDYSASGKTFLSVLEKAGFCKNIFNPEQKGEEENKIIYLNPILHGNFALYGYPGKKSGMEVNEIKKIKLHNSPGLFRILALHTTTEAAGKNLPIDKVIEKELPEAEYYALGHLHIKYENNNLVYAGPTFPNNFQELQELQGGSFYIIETYPKLKFHRKEIKLKDVAYFEFDITNALTAKDIIIEELGNQDLNNKIVLVKVFGKLQQGKTSNIDFKQIENFVKDKGAYVFLKSTSKIITEEPEFNIEIDDMDKLEDEIIEKYKKENPTKYNSLISPLINYLSLEKKEGETSTIFESRLFSEINKILSINIKR